MAMTVLSDTNGLSLESEMAALLGRIPEKDITPKYVGNDETARFANPVERFLKSFQTVQEECARASLELADWLENKAIELRQHAAIINAQSTQIPEDMRRAVEFEDRVRTHIQFLSKVRTE